MSMQLGFFLQDSTLKKNTYPPGLPGVNYVSVLRSISSIVTLNGLNEMISAASLAVRFHNCTKAHPLCKAFPKAWLLHEMYSVS